MIKKIKPKAGQESVWDYPRPPKIETFDGHIRILFNKEIILETNKAFRILETSHPPTYYLSLDKFIEDALILNHNTSYCEFKGKASYYDVSYNGKTAVNAAWGYTEPHEIYQGLKYHVAIYAHMMDACYVNGEKVQSQEGNFYGGWITSNIVGPYKGGLGTWGW